MSRRRPNFSTRTAEEDAARLEPNETGESVSEDRSQSLHWPPTTWSHPEPNSTGPTNRQHLSWPTRLSQCLGWRLVEEQELGERDLLHAPLSAGRLRDASADKKNGHRSRTMDDSKKLGTFSGVFVPTTLNVLSILMFLRFGFILGQAGLLGIIGKVFLSVMIELVKLTS